MASAVMLGVSAESIFNQMYDFFQDSLQSPKIKEKFEKLRDSVKTKQKIDLVTETISNTCKNSFPRDMIEDFDSKIGPILNLIRRLRNDVGHPTGIKIERMEMFSNLMLFRVYAETAYTLINFLKSNKI